MTVAPSAALAALSERFLAEDPRAAAHRLEGFDVSAASAFFSRTSIDSLGPVIEYMSADFAAAVLSALDEKRQITLLAAMDPRYGSLILNYLDGARAEELLNKLPKSAARFLRQMMTYEPDTAGALMDARLTALRDDSTVAAARRRIADSNRRTEVRYFVLDAQNRPSKQLNARDLLIAEPDILVAEIARPAPVPASTDLPREEVAKLIRESGQTLLPVVNAQGRLVGGINHLTLIGELREEAVADIQKMVGVSKDERALSPALFSVRKRLPWLEINLLTAFLAASVVGAFESTIAKYTALAILLPVVAGQSGNAGAQALAVTIRGLALREIGPRQWLPMLLKETKVGLVNGVAVALTTGLAVLLWSQSYGLAAVISLSMVLSMTIANAAGALTPIVLAKLGQDPAQSSSIVLTTITDVAGFMSFLGIATILAQYLPQG